MSRIVTSYHPSQEIALAHVESKRDGITEEYFLSMKPARYREAGEGPIINGVCLKMKAFS